MDTLAHLLALQVTPADAQDRAQVEVLAARIQDVTGNAVGLSDVNQGCTGAQPTAAAAHGIQLEVVPLPETKHGFFVLLPPCWTVECGFACTARFRRLARDYERLSTELAAMRFVAFACLSLTQLLHVASSP